MAHHHTPAVLLGQLTPGRPEGRETAVMPALTWKGAKETCASAVPHMRAHTGSTHALMASVTEPIWLTLSSRQLQALSSTARCILFGLVTVRSSPTICEVYRLSYRPTEEHFVTTAIGSGLHYNQAGLSFEVSSVEGCALLHCWKALLKVTYSGWMEYLFLFSSANTGAMEHWFH